MGLKGIKNNPQLSQTFGLMLFNEKDYVIDFLPENNKKTNKISVLSRFSAWLDQYI